jgi:hypothetical protein
MRSTVLVTASRRRAVGGEETLALWSCCTSRRCVFIGLESVVGLACMPDHSFAFVVFSSIVQRAILLDVPAKCRARKNERLIVHRKVSREGLVWLKQI